MQAPVQVQLTGGLEAARPREYYETVSLKCACLGKDSDVADLPQRIQPADAAAEVGPWVERCNGEGRRRHTWGALSIGAARRRSHVMPTVNL